jgi:hypothetical protein
MVNGTPVVLKQANHEAFQVNLLHDSFFDDNQTLVAKKWMSRKIKGCKNDVLLVTHLNAVPIFAPTYFYPHHSLRFV